MPKGSLIFAPILFKKVLGAGLIDFTTIDQKVQAAKLGVSFALWLCHKVYLKTKDQKLGPSPQINEGVEKNLSKLVKYVKSGLKASFEIGVTFAIVQAFTCSFVT